MGAVVLNEEIPAAMASLVPRIRGRGESCRLRCRICLTSCGERGYTLV
jgi:hypothetical protein